MNKLLAILILALTLCGCASASHDPNQPTFMELMNFGGNRAAWEQSRKPGVKIGMSKAQVRGDTSWGEPDTINRTITSGGVREQWVYGHRSYLYFTDGYLTGVQN